VKGVEMHIAGSAVATRLWRVSTDTLPTSHRDVATVK
jgi:hypothetical protein